MGMSVIGMALEGGKLGIWEINKIFSLKGLRGLHFKKMQLREVIDVKTSLVVIYQYMLLLL